MENQLPYASLILKLLQGVVYSDDKQWNKLLVSAEQIRTHFAEIGLSLHLDEAEGFAYLIQPDPSDLDQDEQPLPRLVRRIPLKYDATLLCVLLRESLQQFDAQSPAESRHVLSRTQLYDMLNLFFPTQTDRVRLERRFGSAIRQVEQVSFLKKLNDTHGSEEHYEVRRIIKAKIDADTLVQIKAQLQQHIAEND